jgi:hypothetical protein
VVDFYRPLSTFLFALERAAFGAEPFPYTAIHVLTHVLNSVLVLEIGRALADRDASPRAVGPILGATLFALHPWHPNAVVFLASFATLFGATFFLAGLWAALEAERRESAPLRVAAWLLYAAALLSYEATVIWPLVVTVSLLGAQRRRAAAIWVPWAICGLYLGGRHALFGSPLGGYAETEAHLLGGAADLFSSGLVSLARLAVPAAVHWTPGQAALAGVLVLIGLVVLVLGHRRRLDALAAGSLLLGALAPFAFQPTVPANGRYVYLAVAGLALVVAVAIRAESRWVRRVVVAGVAVFWLACWMGPLRRHLRAQEEAGDLARLVEGKLAAAVAGREAELTLFGGYPTQLRDEAGAPLAAVLRYGMSDGLKPPFGGGAARVYPLPPRPREAVEPFRSVAARILWWNAASATVEEIPVASAPGLGPGPELAVGGPAGGTITVAGPAEGRAYRLWVVAEGNAVAVEFGPVGAVWPAEFASTMAHLYGSDLLWWVDALDSEGAVVGSSRLRRVAVGS